MSDIVDVAGRLAGIDMGLMRALFGPATVEVAGTVILVVAFTLGALAVALPLTLATTRLVDWARLNAILQRMVRGDDGSILSKQIDNRRRPR